MTSTLVNCHCGNPQSYEACCGLFHLGERQAPTAETLMRSRYSAYCTRQIEYLWQTTHPKQQKYYSKKELLAWAQSNHWVRLEILNATVTTVEFKAYYLDVRLQAQVHHEFSTFVQEAGVWYYVEGR